ncbi:MAG: Antilisterial bacteriocin subtilosin biosynthesis protein AlbA [Parcubacteria group bacterium ADurb.Bin316]|nr:MAG: Antilisterial bacteriocin subtilosin biosynthesis protein AlbA [Parcubacteria group bacterium ADurb.Bin316]
MKIDRTVIDRIVMSIFESWIPHVYLIGGEPSLLGSNRLNDYIELLSQRSSVTIVTNAQIYLEDLSQKLACIGVPIHGINGVHDFLTGKNGSFMTAKKSIERYVARGFDVRCIPVLTKTNFDQIYDIIGLAKQLGMESVFVDRYEDGGIGSLRSAELKPSLEQFRIALGQMIKGRDDFGIPVGWGTAIPFCLDERLLTENMYADCGAGITFCAVNPHGQVRLCNQSERIYGNILNERMEAIWHKPELAEFRDLAWVEKPCTGCAVLADCMCGCKVDANHSSTFCIDYAVRENGRFCEPNALAQKQNATPAIPNELRHFRANRYARLNTQFKEKYLITRYQTIILDENSVSLMKLILSGETEEKSLIDMFVDSVDASEVRRFVSILEQVEAIDIVKE